jgi:sialidase-1
LKTAYGFSSDEEALAYKDYPIDNLEALALAKVPLLHMIGLNDEVVPPDENTYILIDRYIKLGGPATVIPCTEGKQELFGNHFPIEIQRQGTDYTRLYQTNTDLIRFQVAKTWWLARPKARAVSIPIPLFN